jgi:hypothetical protein
MDAPIQPAGSRRSAFRLTSGLDLLEKWSRTATQAEKNVVHQVLFAIADKSVFTDYLVVDDVVKTMEFFVLTRCEITIKVRVHGLNAFGIVYIGPTCDAPGLDCAKPESVPGTLALDERADQPREGQVRHSGPEAAH